MPGAAATSLGTSLAMHGIGGRTDLPLPTWLATTGAVLAVLLTFVAVSAVSPGPRLAAHQGRALPTGAQRVLDSPLTRTALAALALLMSLVVAVVAFTGPEPEGLNLAPYAFYITFWVGLVPASLLLGPLWRVVNPLRLVHRGVERLLRVGSAGAPLPLPARLGWWPAAAWLAVFVWLELVFPDRGVPTTVGAFLVLYALVNLVAAQFFGMPWFDRGDGFEAYSVLVARLSPLGRRADGRLVLRNPVDSALMQRDEPGFLAVVVVLIGSTAFDGLTRTRFWVENVPSDSIPLGTLGLAGITLLVAGLYLVAVVGGARLAGVPHPAPLSVGAGAGAGAVPGPAPHDRVLSPEGAPDEPDLLSTRLPSLFAISLVPIAVGYSIAHYTSLFLYEGQGTWILLSDPFASGANYFGTRAESIDYTVVSPGTVALVQIGAIVLGHVVAVLVAHYRAVELYDERSAVRVLYPLTALMLALTGMAVTLLVTT